MNVAVVALIFSQVCGDGIVDPGEDCFTCPEDVPCLACQECNINHICVTTNCVTCGDGDVDPGETCFTCPADVPCGSDEACVADECVALCTGTPPMDVVFVMDTSGSMGDEALVLCDTIVQIENDLSALGLVANVTLLGITDTGFSEVFYCLTDTAQNVTGVNLIGPEDWGPATAAIAEFFPWTTTARLIVPISDEGAAQGDPCEDPGPDRDAIENAIDKAVEFGVFVSPIAGTSSLPCVLTLGMDLADGTGGTFFETEDPDFDIPNAIYDLILGAIPDCFGDSDGDGIVGITDFLLLLSSWGECRGCPSDLDGNGLVNIVDFLLLLQYWG